MHCTYLYQNHREFVSVCMQIWVCMCARTRVCGWVCTCVCVCVCVRARAVAYECVFRVVCGHGVRACVCAFAFCACLYVVSYVYVYFESSFAHTRMGVLLRIRLIINNLCRRTVGDIFCIHIWYICYFHNISIMIIRRASIHFSDGGGGGGQE